MAFSRSYPTNPPNIFVYVAPMNALFTMSYFAVSKNKIRDILAATHTSFENLKTLSINICTQRKEAHVEDSDDQQNPSDGLHFFSPAEFLALCPALQELDLGLQKLINRDDDNGEIFKCISRTTLVIRLWKRKLRGFTLHKEAQSHFLQNSSSLPLSLSNVCRA